MAMGVVMVMTRSTLLFGCFGLLLLEPLANLRDELLGMMSLTLMVAQAVLAVFNLSRPERG